MIRRVLRAIVAELWGQEVEDYWRGGVDQMRSSAASDLVAACVRKEVEDAMVIERQRFDEMLDDRTRYDSQRAGSNSEYAQQMAMRAAQAGYNGRRGQ